MAERAIEQRKRLAMGEQIRQYAKGGLVVPREKKMGGHGAGCGCMKCGGSVKKGKR